MGIQVIQRPIRLFTSFPSTSVQSLDLVEPPPRPLLGRRSAGRIVRAIVTRISTVRRASHAVPSQRITELAIRLPRLETLSRHSRLGRTRRVRVVPDIIVRLDKAAVGFRIRAHRISSGHVPGRHPRSHLRRDTGRARTMLRRDIPESVIDWESVPLPAGRNAYRMPGLVVITLMCSFDDRRPPGHLVGVVPRRAVIPSRRALSRPSPLSCLLRLSLSLRLCVTRERPVLPLLHVRGRWIPLIPPIVVRAWIRGGGERVCRGR